MGAIYKPFQYQDKGECEIMVCGAFVRQVAVVGDNKGIYDDDIRQQYLDDAQSNMQRFASQHSKKKASASKLAKMANRIRRIAMKISE